MAADMTVTNDDSRATAHRLAGQVGANIDLRLLASLLMWGLARAGRLAPLRILVPDEPGHLARAATGISASGAVIMAVYHRRMVHGIPAKETELDVVVETRHDAHIRQLLEQLVKAGFDIRQLRDTARQEQPGIE